jgi:hypothetical protein
MKPKSFKAEEPLAHCRPLGVGPVNLIQMSYYEFDNPFQILLLTRLDQDADFPHSERFAGETVWLATSARAFCTSAMEHRIMVDPARDHLTGNAGLFGDFGDGPATYQGLMRQPLSVRNRRQNWPGVPGGLLPQGSHGSVRALSGIRLVTS